MKEEIIISFTTWSKRVGNLPTVLDSIYSQTLLPDKVVLNLAYGENIPDNVSEYLDVHKVEINYVEDTKVYKKILPTLKKYPEACVINIDDDCVYPPTMIEEFMAIHQQYPNFPVSGNHEVLNGMQCHCGAASLTKAEYFGKWLEVIDDDLMNNCPSSDAVYTYIAVRNGHPYIHTKHEFFYNIVQSKLENDSYSTHHICADGISKSYIYLLKRFGALENPLKDYVGKYMADVINNIQRNEIEQHILETKLKTEQEVRSSYAYRIGSAIINPFKRLLNH